MAGWRALGRGGILGSAFDYIAPALSTALHGVGGYDEGVTPFVGDVRALDRADIVEMKGESSTVEMTPVVIERSEFLGVIESSISFVNRKFEVNPGLDCTFPWASKVAPGFQQWALEAMMVEYKSMTPSATASFESLGNVCIAAALDPTLPDFEDPAQISMAKFACCRKPDQTFKAPVECGDFASRRYFVRTGDVPAKGTLSAYDPCNIQIATYGQPSAGKQIGNVWVHYRIKLYNPVMRGFGEFCQTAHYTCASPTYNTLFATPTKKVDTIGVLFTDTSTISLPVGSKGRWKLDYTAAGATGCSTSPTVPTVTYTANASAATDYVFANGDTSVTFTGTSGSGRTDFSLVFDVAQNTLPATISIHFNSGQIPTVSATGDFFLNQLSDLSL